MRWLTYLIGWWLFLNGFSSLALGLAIRISANGMPIGWYFGFALYLIPLFLILRRLYSWAKAKRFILPSSFIGWRYAFTAIPVWLSVLAIGGTFALALVVRGSGLSGIPMGIVVTYCSLLAVPALLLTEFSDFRSNASAQS